MLLGLLRAGATVGGYGLRGGKAFLRTPGMGYLGRPLTGMVGGGLYGAFQGEEGTDATMMAQGAMGAALGLAGGLLALPGGFRVAGRALSPVGRLMGGLLGVGSRAVKPGLAQKPNVAKGVGWNRSKLAKDYSVGFHAPDFAGRRYGMFPVQNKALPDVLRAWYPPHPGIAKDPNRGLSWKPTQLMGVGGRRRTLVQDYTAPVTAKGPLTQDLLAGGPPGAAKGRPGRHRPGSGPTKLGGNKVPSSAKSWWLIAAGMRGRDWPIIAAEAKARLRISKDLLGGLSRKQEQVVGSYPRAASPYGRPPTTLRTVFGAIRGTGPNVTKKAITTKGYATDRSVSSLSNRPLQQVGTTSFGFNPNAALPYAARLAGRAGIGLGKLAINHPRPMLYGGLGIAAAVAMNDGSPDMNRIAAIPQSRASMAEGVELPGGVKGMGMPAAQLPANFSSMPNSHTSLRRLQNSTAGLVGGLHNGRHRG